MPPIIIGDGSSEDDETVTARADVWRRVRPDTPRRVRSTPYMQRSSPNRRNSEPRTPSGRIDAREPEPNDGFMLGSPLEESAPGFGIPTWYRFPSNVPPTGPYPHILVYPCPRPDPSLPPPIPFYFGRISPRPPPESNIPPRHNPTAGPPLAPRRRSRSPPARGSYFSPFEPHPRESSRGPNADSRPPPPYSRYAPPDIPVAPVDLSDNPRHMTFETEEVLLQHMVSIYRPLVGVVGRVITEQLALRHRPAVKFDMYAVRVNSVTGGIMIEPYASSRAPIFRITLRACTFSYEDLQCAVDTLRRYMGTYDNAWYRRAGYLFRLSRRSRARGEERERDRVRYWLPPACVWNPVRRPTRGGYRARIRSPAPARVQELAHTQVVCDEESGDDRDQDWLVDGMWRSVCRC
ncbi:Arp complex subunit [Hypoxylon texense]